MHTFTALFDERADAEAIQARLQSLGIVDLDHGLHTRESAGFQDDRVTPDGAVGLWGDARGATPPVEDRRLYEEAVRRGGFLLTINVDDTQAASVREILEASPAVDMSERERELRASGYAPEAESSDEVVPVVEERLQLGRRDIDRGGVRVRAYVVETPVHQEVALREEHVDVRRTPLNATVADAESLFQERAIELTETSEELVVTKEARVVEEISLRKEAGERVETIHDTVRHTEVEIEPLAPQPDGRR